MKASLRAVLILCGVISSVTACAKLAYYKGDSYAPTDKVEVFAAVTDITQDYYIFGEAKIEGTFKATLGTLKGRAAEEAKKRGADAIVLGGASEYGVYSEGFYHASKNEAEELLVFFVKYGTSPQGANPPAKEEPQR